MPVLMLLIFVIIVNNKSKEKREKERKRFEKNKNKEVKNSFENIPSYSHIELTKVKELDKKSLNNSNRDLELERENQINRLKRELREGEYRVNRLKVELENLKNENREEVNINNKEDLLKGVILSEVLGKPKSLRK